MRPRDFIQSARAGWLFAALLAFYLLFIVPQQSTSYVSPARAHSQEYLASPREQTPAVPPLTVPCPPSASLSATPPAPVRPARPPLGFPPSVCGNGRGRNSWGRATYAVWTMCPGNLGPDSIVYAFGVGVDTVWDEAVIEHTGATVYAFDPTSKSVAHVARRREAGKLPSDRFLFFNLALSDKDELLRLHAPSNPDHVSASVVAHSGASKTNTITVPAYSLRTLMRSLNHTSVDVIKLDIEGVEFEVLPQWIADNELNFCNQILIEFHERFYPDGQQRLEKIKQGLTDVGFELYHYRNQEWTFIRLST